jgi:hypothetical protein
MIFPEGFGDCEGRCPEDLPQFKRLRVTWLNGSPTKFTELQIAAMAVNQFGICEIQVLIFGSMGMSQAFSTSTRRQLSLLQCQLLIFD